MITKKMPLGVFSPKSYKTSSIEGRQFNPQIWGALCSRESSLFSTDKLIKKKRGGLRPLTPIPTPTENPTVNSLRLGNVRLFAGMATIVETTIRENEQRLGNTLSSRKYKKKIDDFLKWVCRCSHLHLYCFVAAVGYLHRMVWTPSEEYSSMAIRRRPSKDRLVLTRNNWKLLVTTAIMVAQKVSDDVSYHNIDFVKLLGPAYTIKHLNKMEVAFLSGLNWDCSFTFQEYDAYYRWIAALSEK